ncbi:hypothetical protein DFJ77DRAFT_318217 [Powellomyces hirtus]|nr:hypothetical protein DFJ77DRAFT_318217 [Powellomyces hirtus]
METNATEATSAHEAARVSRQSSVYEDAHSNEASNDTLNQAPRNRQPSRDTEAERSVGADEESVGKSSSSTNNNNTDAGPKLAGWNSDDRVDEEDEDNDIETKDDERNADQSKKKVPAEEVKDREKSPEPEPPKRPIILDIVNGTKQDDKTKAVSDNRPAYTAPFQHPTKPNKFILRNPWDNDTVELDWEAERKAAADFYALHVTNAPSFKGFVHAPGSSTGTAEEAQKLPAERRPSLAVELVPASSAPLTEEEKAAGGFAMGPLLPPMFDFLPENGAEPGKQQQGAGHAEGSGSKAQKAGAPRAQNPVGQGKKPLPPAPNAGLPSQIQRPAQPPQQQQQQHQGSQEQSSAKKHSSFEQEMLAIFDTVRYSHLPAGAPTPSSSFKSTNPLTESVRDKLPPPPSTAATINKPYTPAIPPPKRNPPPPPAVAGAAPSSAASSSSSQHGGQQPQQQKLKGEGLKEARQSLDAIQMAALSLAANLEVINAFDPLSNSNSQPKQQQQQQPAAPAAASTTATGPARGPNIITPTVLSAKRVQVTPANRPGPQVGAYTATTSWGSVIEMPRIARGKSSEKLAKQAQQQQQQQRQTGGSNSNLGQEQQVDRDAQKGKGIAG